jgi:hypothetical protein
MLGGRPEPVTICGSGKYPRALKMYCHVWSEGRGWHWNTIGQKRQLRDEMLAAISAPTGTRWLAAFTDGAMAAKHALAYCTINIAGQSLATAGLQQERVTIGAQGGTWPCLDLVQEAYDGGMNKAMLLGAEEPSPGRLLQIGIDRYRAWTRALSRYRETAELELAVWLAQHEETDEPVTEHSEALDPGGHTADGADLGRPDDQADDPLLVQGKEAPDHVEPRPGRDGGGGAADHGPRGVVDADPAVPPAQGVVARQGGQHQLSLLGLLDLQGAHPRPAGPVGERGGA